MRILRKGINILVMCIVVIIIAITALCMFVDPNRLKPLITTQVRNQTGYQVEIDGNFTWSFYPRIGVKAESMQVTAPEQKVPFLVMHDVMFGMDFFQLLRGKSDLSGDVHVKKLWLKTLQAENVSADLAWENKVLTISPFSALLYDGWMTATIYGRDLAKTPRWDWEMQFSRVNVKPLLQDLNGKDTKLIVDGVGQLRMDAGTSGTSKNDFINHLRGNLNFSLSHGAVSGIDLNYLIGSAVELIRKEPLSAPGNTSQTAFESLTGTMKIKSGVASSEDTLLVAPAFVVKAHGSIDMSHQVIDYNLDVIPKQLEQFKWAVPIDLTGDLNDPSIKLDMLKLNTIIANEQFQRLKEKTQEKLKKLPARVDNFLQKVFGDQ